MVSAIDETSVARHDHHKPHSGPIEFSLMVHSHLRFSQLLRGPELIVEQWVTLYYMGAFTPVIWSTIAWTEKFNNGLCTHFLRLRGLKSSHNSSCLKNRRCELSLNTQCYQCWHFCTTSNEKKLEVFANEINFTTNVQLSCCFEYKLR